MLYEVITGADFNKDDLLEIGVARTVPFPPTDAPEAFIEGWAAATQGMSYNFV